MFKNKFSGGLLFVTPTPTLRNEEERIWKEWCDTICYECDFCDYICEYDDEVAKAHYLENPTHISCSVKRKKDINISSHN